MCHTTGDQAAVKIIKTEQSIDPTNPNKEIAREVGCLQVAPALVHMPLLILSTGDPAS